MKQQIKDLIQRVDALEHELALLCGRVKKLKKRFSRCGKSTMKLTITWFRCVGSQRLRKRAKCKQGCDFSARAANCPNVS